MTHRRIKVLKLNSLLWSKIVQIMFGIALPNERNGQWHVLILVNKGVEVDRIRVSPLRGSIMLPFFAR